jgi:hypothetical protein
MPPEENRMMATNTPLVVIELLSASVWVGSLVCLAVVTSAARKVLDASSQVALFRLVGRRYGIVGTGSLLVAIGVGLTLAWPPKTWSAAFDAAVALAGVLILATALGIAQARRMTIHRSRALHDPADRTIDRALHRGKLLARVLRSTLGLVSVAIVVLVGYVISH